MMKLFVMIVVMISAILYFELSIIQSLILIGVLLYAADVFKLKKTLSEFVVIFLVSIVFSLISILLSFAFDMSLKEVLNADFGYNHPSNIHSHIAFFHVAAIVSSTLGFCVLIHCIFTRNCNMQQLFNFFNIDNYDGEEIILEAIRILLLVVFVGVSMYIVDQYFYKPCGFSFSSPKYFFTHRPPAFFANLGILAIAAIIFYTIGIFSWFRNHVLFRLTITILILVILSATLVNHFCNPV